MIVGPIPPSGASAGADPTAQPPVPQAAGPAAASGPAKAAAPAAPQDNLPRDGMAFETVMSDALASPIGAHVTLHGGLSELRARARQVQTELGEQPLPISNQSSRVLLKLFGG